MKALSVLNAKNPMDVIKKKHWWQSDALKWSVLGLLGLLVGYLVVLMYAQGEYLFAITTLILSSAGLYIFADRKAYAWRYVYPGMAGMGLFVLPGLHHRHCLHQLQQH
ncbi:hypothetical protein ACLB1T_14025 [Escherichia coli]